MYQMCSHLGNHNMETRSNQPQIKKRESEELQIADSNYAHQSGAYFWYEWLMAAAHIGLVLLQGKHIGMVTVEERPF